MECPHCGIAFHADWKITPISEQQKIPVGVASLADTMGWYSKVVVCPSCKEDTIDILKVYQRALSSEPTQLVNLRAFPVTTNRRPTPPEVPPHIREDYEEACRVIPISEKASAALSRRCLQAVLSDQGYQQRDLSLQIDALLTNPDPSKSLPTLIKETVDAIRNFGNFSAHTITDRTTLQIIQVEPHEAEWCLEILEELFDYYYVKPKQAAARKAALDAKLVAAGKPKSK